MRRRVCRKVDTTKPSLVKTTNPLHREEEPHNNHETPERQTKQHNQLSLPHQNCTLGQCTENLDAFWCGSFDCNLLNSTCEKCLKITPRPSFVEVVRVVHDQTSWRSREQLGRFAVNSLSRPDTSSWSFESQNVISTMWHFDK